MLGIVKSQSPRIYFGVSSYLGMPKQVRHDVSILYTFFRIAQDTTFDHSAFLCLSTFIKLKE